MTSIGATGRALMLTLLLAGLALPPLLGANIYILHVLNLAWISAIAALGLNIATGITGQIVLGQAALMGIGAYTCSLAMLKLQLPWWIALPAAMAVAGLVGVLLGVVSVRIRGHYLAITTLALNEIFRIVVVNEDWLTGGPMGLRDIPVLNMPLLGDSIERQLYLPLLAIAIAVFAFTLRFYRTGLGRDMRAVRDDELAAEAMGINSPALKTTAFVICSVWAGLAGALYVLLVGFISPNNFTIFESIKLLLMVVVGGLGSIAGTFLGALVVIVLPEVLRGLQTYYLAGFAIGVVIILLIEPRGLGIFADWLIAPWLPGFSKGKIATQPLDRTAVQPAGRGSLTSLVTSSEFFKGQSSASVAPMSSPILEVSEVVKTFGGVKALDRVSFDVQRGEIVGLIGPNGSGKSTLINACSGNVTLTDGSIDFAGKTCSNLQPWQVHALGVSRIFQNVRLWESLTVLENVMIPHQASRNGSVVQSVVGSLLLQKREDVAREAALQALDLIGIRALADRYAGDLSFGQSRLVELARAVVSRPKLLLLDEPAAGLRGGLVLELADILRRLRDHGMSILVVEHRVKLVVSMCDRVVVLNLGEKIAEGLPLDVARNPLVITAYLGDRYSGVPNEVPA